MMRPGRDDDTREPFAVSPDFGPLPPIYVRRPGTRAWTTPVFFRAAVAGTARTVARWVRRHVRRRNR